ncbi:coenzyme PQQ synthesis protein [Novosphingobium barchaimii LL02]|uniref:Coenzyme PQQ synthesis protein n=1 Tax=Novosphingobium barchaimii LL02 TaxID=1114963 RepID=A0A0J7XVI5_9SPHN|nr:PqqD family protein [Novosphingobium barchaimii]KMS55103.1 coenzyme PQQ synthesis protein [Novosphingobium barchaimii LL02]
MTAVITSVETFTKNPTTATAEVDGQLVALDIQAGVCFGLNEVATRIWKLLDEHHDVPALCDALLDIYDVDRATCEEETLALLRELVDAGLVGRA